MKTAAEIAFQLAFEISPVILSGGIAQNMPGGVLPLVSITESANFITGILSGGVSFNLDNFFAHFRPASGGTLISQDYGRYPFANQAVAANSVITKPLRISAVMTCPARPPGGYPAKLATIMALQAALAQHNVSGGTYTFATPFYFYTNLLLLELRDVSAAGGKQPQTDWEWDFEQPMLTLNQATQALGGLMSQISAGTPIDGQPAWSGLSPTVGQPPSVASPSIVPAAGGPAGGISGPFALPAAAAQ